MVFCTPPLDSLQCWKHTEIFMQPVYTFTFLPSIWHRPNKFFVPENNLHYLKRKEYFIKYIIYLSESINLNDKTVVYVLDLSELRPIMYFICISSGTCADISQGLGRGRGSVCVLFLCLLLFLKNSCSREDI